MAQNSNSGLLNSEFLACGALTGAATKTASAPLERVLLFYQTQGMLKNSAGSATGLKYNSIFGALKTIVKEESFTGLFRGNFSNIIRASAVYSIKFGTNDTLKGFFREADGTISFRNVIASAAVAGAVQKVTTFPLDMVALRIAMGVNSKELGKEGAYKGMGDCVRRMYMHEGIRGFYKGLGVTIWSGVPYVVLQLTLFEYVQRATRAIFGAQGSVQATLRKVLGTPDDRPLPGMLNATCSFVASSSAGAFTALLSKSAVFPLDTVRKRLMIDGMDGKLSLYGGSSATCARMIMQQEGWRALFAGLKPTALKAVVGGAVQFGAYETFKDFCLRYNHLWRNPGAASSTNANVAAVRVTDPLMKSYGSSPAANSALAMASASEKG